MHLILTEFQFESQFIYGFCNSQPTRILALSRPRKLMEVFLLTAVSFHTILWGYKLRFLYMPGK